MPCHFHWQLLDPATLHYIYVIDKWCFSRPLVFWSLFGAWASNRARRVFFRLWSFGRPDDSPGLIFTFYYTSCGHQFGPNFIDFVPFEFFPRSFTPSENALEFLSFARKCAREKKRPAQNSIGYVRSFIVSVVRFRCPLHSIWLVYAANSKRKLIEIDAHASANSYYSFFGHVDNDHTQHTRTQSLLISHWHL